MNDVSREYPRTVSCNGATMELRLMSSDDAADLKTFIASLPEHDLLFLSRDITHPKVIEAWIAAIAEGRVKSLVARENGVIVGCTAIVLHELSWSRHVGELRVLVSPSWRGWGLGTSVTIDESDCARAPCGDVTQGGGIPWMAVRQYAGRHDRHASDSAKMGVRRLEAR